MNRKFIIILISLIVLIQHSVAKTKQNTSHVEESTESTEQFDNFMSSSDLAKLTPRGRLFAHTLARYSKSLIRFTLKEGRELVQAALNDTAALKSPSEALQLQLTKLSRFADQASNLELNADNASVATVYRRAFKLVVELADILERYKSDRLAFPSMEEMLVKLSLEKYGLERLHTEFAALFEKFELWFLERVDRFLAALSADERQRESAMIAWYRQFKTEPKVQLFDKFVDLFDMNVVFKDIEGWQ